METEMLPATLPPANLNGKALVTMVDDQPAFLPMPVQVVQIVARVKAVKEIVSQVFQEGNHFGEIPGTAKNKDGSAKLVLLKPGFDALCMAFQFAPEFLKQPETVESDKFINIVYKCRIVHSPTGRVIATGDGSCNSKEEKYRWTTTARKCPHCNAEAIIKGKEEYGGGWVCFEKKGGCKAKFRDGDPAIEGQKMGRIENDNPWNFHNTLTKMAQKRAGMAAIITACGLSSDFTQDLEDTSEYGNGPTPSNSGVQWPTQAAQPGGRAGAVDKTDGPDPRFCDPPQDNGPEAEWRPSAEELDRVEDNLVEPGARRTESEFPADIAKAREGVTIDLKYCKTKEHFQKLIAQMRKNGGVMVDKRVTCLVNDAYNTLFPAQTKGA